MHIMYVEYKKVPQNHYHFHFLFLYHIYVDIMYVYCIMIKEMLNKKKWVDQEKFLIFLIGVLPPNNFTDFSKN